MDWQVFHDIIKPILIDDTLPLINWLTENEILPREKYEWKAYGKIAESEYYDHKTVNHSYHTLHFVDPNTGVHTQNIEFYWNKHKQRMKKMCGYHPDSLGSYLNELMWMEKNQNQKFLNFIKLL